VAGARVGRHVAYGEYLRVGRASVDLAPTLVWESILIFLGVLTASVPVLMHVLAELGTAHLLTTNHTSSGKESSHQLSTLKSGSAAKGTGGAKVSNVGVSGGSNDGGMDWYDGVRDEWNIGTNGGDGGESIAATTQNGRSSQESQTAILPEHRSVRGGR